MRILRLVGKPRVLRTARVRTVVPPFSSLVQVQDKLSATATLKVVGLPQPGRPPGRW